MGDVSKHFDRAEFRCKCGMCEFEVVDVELLAVLEDLRDMTGKPVRITSGCRCPTYNKQVGGVWDSQHLKGIAADIVIDGYSPGKVHEYLNNKYHGRYGLGSYTTFTHIDVRRRFARWAK